MSMHVCHVGSGASRYAFATNTAVVVIVVVLEGAGHTHARAHKQTRTHIHARTRKTRNIVPTTYLFGSPFLCPREYAIIAVVPLSPLA